LEGIFEEEWGHWTTISEEQETFGGKLAGYSGGTGGFRRRNWLAFAEEQGKASRLVVEEHGKHEGHGGGMREILQAVHTAVEQEQSKSAMEGLCLSLFSSFSLCFCFSCLASSTQRAGGNKGMFLSRQ